VKTSNLSNQSSPIRSCLRTRPSLTLRTSIQPRQLRAEDRLRTVQQQFDSQHEQTIPYGLQPPSSLRLASIQSTLRRESDRLPAAALNKNDWIVHPLPLWPGTVAGTGEAGLDLRARTRRTPVQNDCVADPYSLQLPTEHHVFRSLCSFALRNSIDGCCAMLKNRRSRVRVPMMSMNHPTGLILPSALRPWNLLGL
jgi:hypothetical protein